jgi:group I intron endonuclease
MTSGVYIIKNITNNKIYIGSTINVDRRLKKHLSLLRRGKHHSEPLQRSWNKYGESNFVFYVREVCEKSKLIEREQYYIDKEKPEYNICPNAASRLGYKHKKETKEKISKSLIGKPSGFKNKKHTEETKKRLSEANLGKKMSKEAREKMRLANLGRKRSEEEKKKISESMKKIKTPLVKDKDLILLIREQHSNGRSLRSLAEEHGLGRTVITNIVKKKHGYEE